MSVQFIDNASIDKKTRSLIRSHVAKGKNLGRTVYRPSRYPKKRQVAAVSAIPSTEPDKNSELSPSIQRKFQEDLATSLPFAVSRACRRLFHECWLHQRARIFESSPYN
ncbi:hypothetical protein SAMD00023353_3901010 [Rosellinia necatrix]|uniref:Uncharacterized protein n=1 Tax=Rosellinia necatrix TaxID=77044 RepID=A0A1S8A9I5_ROSNE|nr:hypothetical protein SAMD00023353_3901010 [Rosellinia necatrix]